MHENESLASQVLQAKTAVGPTDMQQATFMLPKKIFFPTCLDPKLLYYR